MNDNHHNDTPEERLKKLTQEQRAKSMRDAELAELATQATGKMSNKLEAVRILHKADKKRFSSALSTLMKKD